MDRPCFWPHPPLAQPLTRARPPARERQQKESRPMKRSFGLFSAALMLLGFGTAFACHVEGHVYCDGTALPLQCVVVRAVSTDPGAPFTGTATTDADGYYYLVLPNAVGQYHVTIDLGPSESVVTPVAGFYDIQVTAPPQGFVEDWEIASPSCAQEGCWLTGGGAKFSQITDTYLAETGKKHNFGGNG